MNGGRKEIHGLVHVQHVRAGRVIAEQTAHNVTCTAGVAAVNATVSGTGSSVFFYIAIGTSNTAPTGADTALGAELLRATAGWTAGTTSSTNDTAVLTCSFNFGSNHTIQEAGLFSTPTLGGIILGHVLIGPFSVFVGDQLNLTWNEVY